MTKTEEAINVLIQGEGVNTNIISDGYHTFGELYEHRIQIYIALCKQIHWAYKRTPNEESPVWMSRFHSDGSQWDGWFILGINTEKEKQMTYHLPIDKWYECEAFAKVLVQAPEYDGHTSIDVLNRLKTL